MAELKTRISLKYDTLENWKKSTLGLNKGELAIVEIPTADPANKQLPPVMFKVGVDGTKTFKELNWASALAADVYSWAKKSGITVEKNGTGNVVTNIEWSNDKLVLTLGLMVAKVKMNSGEKTPDADGVVDLGIVLTDASAFDAAGAAAGVLGTSKDTAAKNTVYGAKAAANNAQGLAKAAQDSLDTYKISNNKALAEVKKTADAAQTETQVNAKISAHNTAADAHSDIRQSVTALAEKVSGRATAYVYKNKSDAAYTTAIGKTGSFVVGDTIYFTDTNILDEWVTKVNAAAPYYEFQEIETEKPSFDGYVKGTGLTDKKIILGAGGSNVKASTYGVSGTLTATDAENLPTSKAVASYVGGEIGKITIPTVNNAALKDASGATIFTANASTDVEILLIDCGNASGWDA